MANSRPWQAKLSTDNQNSGLAWHTEEATLRQKFEEFGVVEEAVRAQLLSSIRFARCPRIRSCQRSLDQLLDADDTSWWSAESHQRLA